MATSTPPISCTDFSFSTNPSSFSSPLNFSKPWLPPKRRRHVKISCTSSSPNSNNNANPNTPNLSQGKLDRRNVLLGLGGLYGAYNFPALASPVPAPDISTCGPPTITNSTDPVPYSCCPPFSDTVVDYKVPSFSTINVRPAAHAVDDEYLEKYKTAVQKMKDLPGDDPRNFYQQANVHCAYCNDAYQLAGKPYQIHLNWLFFPFHRWYLYFHERILQTLIDDPTFTLPYWNWDNPQGMILPEIFDADASSPLYDENRDKNHRNGYVMDLAYSAGDETAASDLQKVKNNLAIMYRQMLTNAPCPLLFFGRPIRGEEGYNGNSGMGTIEEVPHNSVHQWVGDPNADHFEDMGSFYSAAKDPVFYCHHANVDRMWTIWKSLGGKRTDIADTDWLQSEFVFYDENKNLVKVKVEDCLDNEKLGYTFQDMPTPWKNFKPTRKRTAKLSSAASISASTDALPATLDKILTFSVTRPSTSRTSAEKEAEEELLNVYISYDDTQFIRFDVFLNEDNDVDANELDRVEYAGSFANLAHVHNSDNRDGSTTGPTSSTFSLAITEVLEDLGLEGDDMVLVTLVPKAGGSLVNVTSADITTVAC